MAGSKKGQKVEVICSQCGQVRLVHPSNARRSKTCKVCHNRNIAPKGWAATKAKYGEKIAVQQMQKYRWANPSNLEQLVAQKLDELGLYYQREWWFKVRGGKVYLVDFHVSHHGRELAIEVNGFYAHQFHAERDRQKVKALARRMKVLVLTECDLQQDFSNRILDLLSLGA